MVRFSALPYGLLSLAHWHRLRTSCCQFQRGSLDEESLDPLEISPTEADEDGLYLEQLQATEDIPAKAEDVDATTDAQPHYSEEELLSLQEEFVRLQRESRLLDKQIATNEAALLVRQAELDRFVSFFRPLLDSNGIQVIVFVIPCPE